MAEFRAMTNDVSVKILCESVNAIANEFEAMGLFNRGVAYAIVTQAVGDSELESTLCAKQGLENYQDIHKSFHGWHFNTETIFMPCRDDRFIGLHRSFDNEGQCNSMIANNGAIFKNIADIAAAI